MMITGVDIIKIDRVRKILDKKGEAFCNKIFTKNEIDYLKKRKNSIKTISGLFASKEAVSKAIGTGIGKIGWKDIEIYHNPKGKPMVNLSTKGWKAIKDLQINDFDISISHEKEYAIAFVIGYYNVNQSEK